MTRPEATGSGRGGGGRVGSDRRVVGGSSNGSGVIRHRGRGRREAGVGGVTGVGGWDISGSRVRSVRCSRCNCRGWRSYTGSRGGSATIIIVPMSVDIAEP